MDIIRKTLSDLNDDKVAGNDNLSPRLLKAVADEIAYPVAMIFRKSLDSGAVPRDWKTANVTPNSLDKNEAIWSHPYLKKEVSGEHATIPVSLTSQICKVAESVLRDELLQHDLISKSQHGFRKGYVPQIC